MIPPPVYLFAGARILREVHRVIFPVFRPRASVGLTIAEQKNAGKTKLHNPQF